MKKKKYKGLLGALGLIFIFITFINTVEDSDTGVTIVGTSTEAIFIILFITHMLAWVFGHREGEKEANDKWREFTGGYGPEEYKIATKEKK